MNNQEGMQPAFNEIKQQNMPAVTGSAWVCKISAFIRGMAS